MFIRYAMVVVLFLMAHAVMAETYYVATDGKTDFSGSKDKPWPSVGYALSKVGAGHTIIVRPGLYHGPIWIAERFAGTEQKPTVIKSEVKWQAVIVGAEYHVISNAGNCDWLTIDGFEVMGGRYDGIKMNGDYNIVLRYATQSENARRDLIIDGKHPCEGCKEFHLPSTGGFSSSRDDWEYFRIPGKGQDRTTSNGAVVALTAGEHTLRMSNLGDGCALDQILIVPAS